MNQKSYDEKNKADYDDYTTKLNDALDKISNDPKRPATQAEVIKMTGISRGTVRDRGFPATRLKEIKEQRKKDEISIKQETRNKLEIITEERDNIAKEIIHWFSNYESANKDRADFERQANRNRDNAEFYKKAFEEEKEKVRTLEFTNKQLKELLRDIKK